MDKQTDKPADKTSSPAQRLYRSEKDRVIAGVAGGLGEYFGVDSNVARLIFILLGFYGGSGIIVYLILWLIIPKKSDSSKASDEMIRDNVAEIRDQARAAVNTVRESRSGGSYRYVVGIILVFFGIIFFLNNFGYLSVSVGQLWPVVLIVFGLSILLKNER